MSKHTPGPWRVGLPPLHKGLTIGTRQGLMVAFVTTGWNVPTRDNARLIAAAPDLLSACHRLLEAVPYVSEYDVPIGLWDDLQSAVNKATGGNQ